MKLIDRFIRKYDYWRVYFKGKYFPLSLAQEIYYGRFGKYMNLQNPRNLNEKINWLKFNSDTSIWTLLADKYRVREWLENKGLIDYLVPLYGVWEKPNEIDMAVLPNEFVLKTNNSCGTVILVENKQQVAWGGVKQKLNKWLNTPFGYRTAEPHYTHIKPLIIAEKLLRDNNQLNSLIDYKFFCFSGEPYCVLVCQNRNIGVHADVSIYSINFELMPNAISGPHANDDSSEVCKPVNFNKMIEISKIISKDFYQIRVDFYEVDGKLYIGELTLTSEGGYMNYFSQEMLDKMGDKIKLPNM